MEEYTKKQISKIVDRPNSTINDWIRDFGNYIQTIKIGRTSYYKSDAITVLNMIKELRDKGISKEQILSILQEKGVPKVKEDFKKIIEEASPIDDIPTAQQIMLPYLEILQDGKVYSANEITDELIKYFNLTQEQIDDLNPSGKETKFAIRIRWARYNLKKSLYIETVGQATYQITKEGLNFLNSNNNDDQKEIKLNFEDPFDILKEKYLDIKRDLGQEIINQIKKAPPEKLENIVVELLTSMGYGDGEVTRKTNDGGIDGIIKEDKLGLGNIYLQAKRWDGSVGREQIQSFSGALDGVRAKKGVFITTSYFTKGAIDYVKILESNKKIILIDGERLTDLMIEYDIGVSTKERFLVKKIDFDYFLGDD